MDELTRTMKQMNDLIYSLNSESNSLCCEKHQNYTKYLISVMNNNLKFNSRNEILFMGDEFNLMVCSWISILKSLMVRRSAFLEPNKVKNPINGKKSDKLRDMLLRNFMRFLSELDLKSTKNILGPWVIKAFEKL